MVEDKEKNKYRLEIPLDASGIEEFKPEKGVKVLLADRSGPIVSQIAKLDESGKGIAVFTFPERPVTLRLLMGPENVEDRELLGMQTLSMDIPTHRWREKYELILPPLVISPYYWHWWLIWCRTFTITGRVVCPDGNPVPGARVCVNDVDIFWWWSSVSQVACATTDATGSFKIKFRWCCGWWPRWWWAQRVWRLEPTLVDRILPELRRDPRIPRIPLPDPKPDLGIFHEILAEDKTAPVPPSVSRLPATLKGTSPKQREEMTNFEVAALDHLGEKLRNRLPAIPAIDRLRLWPWWPWHPWWDCTPDIIFRVTQNCSGQEAVIVNETVWDTRWNIPTNLSVTLVANDQACCIDPSTTQPEGNCINLTHFCNVPLSDVGGNLGAPAVPEGYHNPGLHTIYGDQPYAGNVTIRGDFGTLAGADYYELQWYDTTTSSWKAMPPGSVAGFSRRYFGPRLPSGPTDIWLVPFPVQSIDGHEVIESRQHFEANNGAGTWEVLGQGSHWWMHHKDLLVFWRTQGHFPDGTYQLRVKTWQLVGGHLSNPQILGQCGTSPAKENKLVITIDNRDEGNGPTDSNGHSCGIGTVHRCTSEPDTEILAVKIVHTDGSETNVEACGEVPINDTDKLRIDFVAHDPEGHLAYFTLNATYGESKVKNLLELGGTLSPGPSSVSWAPVAAQVGPWYTHLDLAKSALDQGAVSPKWYGGVMRLEVKAKDAFPKSCCYQLELRAHKRTIVNCDGNLWGHTNYSEYSFMIVVTK